MERRGNGQIHLVSTGNARGVFGGMAPGDSVFFIFIVCVLLVDAHW